MNTNTTTDTAANANASKKARTPRAKKAAPVTAGTEPETPKAPTATHAAQTAASVAAAFCILVTLPPMEKFEAGMGYWQIEIRDRQDRRCSNVYRTKDLDKAHALAEKMARERNYPIVTQEPPAPRAALPAAEPIPMPDPEEEDGADQPEAGADFDDATGTPF